MEPVLPTFFGNSGFVVGRAFVVQRLRDRIEETKKREKTMEKTENKGRFPLFHSKSPCCGDGDRGAFEDQSRTRPQMDHFVECSETSAATYAESTVPA